MGNGRSRPSAPPALAFTRRQQPATWTRSGSKRKWRPWQNARFSPRPERSAPSTEPPRCVDSVHPGQQRLPRDRRPRQALGFGEGGHPPPLSESRMLTPPMSPKTSARFAARRGESARHASFLVEPMPKGPIAGSRVVLARLTDASRSPTAVRHPDETVYSRAASWAFL